MLANITALQKDLQGGVCCIEYYYYFASTLATVVADFTIYMPSVGNVMLVPLPIRLPPTVKTDTV